MPRRNVTWTRDELILALEFYMRHRASGAMPRQNSQEIKFLSETLNKLAVLHDLPRGENFRNENGVYLKLMNFHHIDPHWSGQGMAGVSRADRAVFADFAERPETLKNAAKAILQHVYHYQDLDTGSATSGILAAAEDQAPLAPETTEGRILSVSHLRRERNPRLVERLKDEYFDRHKYLDCAVCQFDYERRYGQHGHKFMEAHHIRPLSELDPEGETVNITDLALICSNCHRMVHRKSPWLTLAQLKGMLQ